MPSKAANFAIDPLVSLMYRLKSNPRLRRLLVDARNRNFFVGLDRHERMLSDRIRIDTYHRAISKHVEKGDVVVDLGTGTGILSFFAAQREPKKIYAIDHADVIEMAKLVAKHNRIDSIEFLQVNSRSFTPAEKVNVLIQEQMASHLFAENMVQNICDMRDRILTDDGRIIPERFSIFMEPVRLKDEYTVPHLWEMNLYGVKFDCLRGRPTTENSIRNIHPHQVQTLLCDPEPVLELDLRTVDPSALPRRLCYRKRITIPGRMDGVCLYWTAHFDDELVLSSSPLAPDTVWGSVFLRADRQEYDSGTTLEFTWTIGELTEVASWHYTVRSYSEA